MSFSRRLMLFCAAALFVPVAFASSITIVNPDFSIPSLCPQGYAYQMTTAGGSCSGPIAPQQDFNGTAGFGWTLNSGAGIYGNGLTDPNSAFNPPSFSGLPFAQAAFLQADNGSVSQSLTGFTAGQEYRLSFYLGSRYHSGDYDGNQTVQVLIGGQVISTLSLTSSSPFALREVDFLATGNSQTLEFRGASSGDHTAFLSGVGIASVPEPATLTLLATGLLGLAGIKRRFL